MPARKKQVPAIIYDEETTVELDSEEFRGLMILYEAYRSYCQQLCQKYGVSKPVRFVSK